MRSSNIRRLVFAFGATLLIAKIVVNLYHRHLTAELPQAVVTHNLTRVQYLLAHGADPTIKDENDFGDLLPVAVQACDADIALALLRAGAKPNGVAKNSGRTALQSAVLGEPARMGAFVVAAIDKGANIDVASTADSKHHCLLFDAARESSAEIVELLLDRGAVSDRDGKNDLNILLAQAAGGNKIDTVRLLLKRGASAHSIGGGLGLLEAADAGNVEVLTLLLNAGADVNSTGTDGNTALASSITKGNIDVVRLLLSRDADVYKYTGIGHNALYYAEHSRNPQIKELISKAASRKRLALQ